MVNPVPVAPTLDDATDLTIAMDLSGPFESRHVPPISASLISDNRYRRRILKFVEAVRPQHGASESSRGLLDVAFTSIQTLQDTIAHLSLSTYPPECAGAESLKCLRLLRVLFGADQPRSAQVRARSKPYVVRRYR